MMTPFSALRAEIIGGGGKANFASLIGGLGAMPLPLAPPPLMSVPVEDYYHWDRDQGVT